jgi:hypothetical protein
VRFASALPAAHRINLVGEDGRGSGSYRLEMTNNVWKNVILHNIYITPKSFLERAQYVIAFTQSWNGFGTCLLSSVLSVARSVWNPRGESLLTIQV